MIPIRDRIENERERALRLPAPERTDTKQNNVTLPYRCIDNSRLARQLIAASE